MGDRGVRLIFVAVAGDQSNFGFMRNEFNVVTRNGLVHLLGAGEILDLFFFSRRMANETLRNLENLETS